MEDKPKKTDESEQTDIAVLEDERQADNFVSEWSFHSKDDPAEFFPRT